MGATTDGDGASGPANATIVKVSAVAAVTPLLLAATALVLCAAPVWPLTEAEPFGVVAGAAALGALTLLLTREPVSFATAVLSAVLPMPVLTAAGWFGGGTVDELAFAGAAIACTALIGWAASSMFRGAAAGLLFVSLTAAPPCLWILLAVGGASSTSLDTAGVLAALSPIVAAARHEPSDLTCVLVPALLLCFARGSSSRKNT